MWRIKRDGISAKKFEAARLHILSDILVAVAVVVSLSSLTLLSFNVFNIVSHSMLVYLLSFGSVRRKKGSEAGGGWES